MSPEAERDPEDQEGRRRGSTRSRTSGSVDVRAVRRQAGRVERREVRLGVVVGVLQRRPGGVDDERAEDDGGDDRLTHQASTRWGARVEHRGGRRLRCDCRHPDLQKEERSSPTAGRSLRGTAPEVSRNEEDFAATGYSSRSSMRLVFLGRGTETRALHQHARAAVPAQDGVVVSGRPDRFGLRVPLHRARKPTNASCGASGPPDSSFARARRSSTMPRVVAAVVLGRELLEHRARPPHVRRWLVRKLSVTARRYSVMACWFPGWVGARPGRCSRLAPAR